jgi:hypothetical protein
VAYRSPSLRVSKRLDAHAAASGLAQNVEISALGSRSEDSAAPEHRSFTPSTEEKLGRHLHRSQVAIPVIRTGLRRLSRAAEVNAGDI